MSRDNYFDLLKLNTNPPENNEAVIREAIEKALNRWQDMKNKGINSAKWEKLLELKDDINKVMLDPVLRKQEADAAKNTSNEKSTKSWYEEYSKKIAPIEKLLDQLNFLSLYDFISQSTSESDICRSYGLNDSCKELKERVSKITAAYRIIKDKQTEQELSGKCASIFESTEKKDDYDKYIQQKFTESIELAVKMTQDGGVLSAKACSTIVEKYTKSWFIDTKVLELINSYCKKQNYTVEQPNPSSSKRNESYSNANQPDQHASNNSYSNNQDPRYNTNNGQQQYQQTGTSNKNTIVTFFLCIFLGFLGFHRFYTGKIGTGILYFLTLGFAFIGVVLDAFMIANGKFKDKIGYSLKKWMPGNIVCLAFIVIVAILIFTGNFSIISNIVGWRPEFARENTPPITQGDTQNNNTSSNGNTNDEPIEPLANEPISLSEINPSDNTRDSNTRWEFKTNVTSNTIESFSDCLVVSSSSVNERVASIDFLIDGNFTKMSGTTFLADEGKDVEAPQRIIIWADGQIIYQSEDIIIGFSPDTFELDVLGAKLLRIGVEFDSGRRGRTTVGIADIILYP